jgi:Zn-dependent protease with chaperone function
MFNNIIYFIIALFIIFTNNPEKSDGDSLLFSICMMVAAWIAFFMYCRLEFHLIKRKAESGTSSHDRMTSPYQRVVIKLSTLALLLFAIYIHVFDLKYWVVHIPVANKLSVFHDALTLSVFFIFLVTIWYAAHPAYRVIFKSEIRRKSYVLSNIRLYLPIIFPWFFLSLAYDLVVLFPVLNLNGFLRSDTGQIIFFVVLMGILVIFLPVLIRFFWGCKALESTEKVLRIKDFLNEKSFKYRSILDWPVFEGRLMTAGIMGVIPRYRYLLVTDSLLKALSADELEAVMAHEMGHAKYRHILFYLLFFLGFMIVSPGFYDLPFYLFLVFPSLAEAMSDLGETGVPVAEVIQFMPVLILLLIYFRYIMGFFMRNFERQADLYSAQLIGSPIPTISSLEKIAAASGKIRDLPSWHHFSIRERVEYLWRTLKEPVIFKNHNRMLVVSFIIYLLGMGGAAYFLNFSEAKQHVIISLGEKGIKKQLMKNPESISINESLAKFYYKTGKEAKAFSVYEKILELKPDHAEALNYVGYTYAEKGIHLDEAQDMIQKALRLKPDSGAITDSLGWVYFKKGKYDEALYYLEKAHSLLPGDPVVNEHLGDVMFIKKDYSKAIEIYKRTLNLGHPAKNKLREKISRIEEILRN